MMSAHPGYRDTNYRHYKNKLASPFYTAATPVLLYSMAHKTNPSHLLLTSVALLTSTCAFNVNGSEQIGDRITVVGKKPDYLNDPEGILPVTFIDFEGLSRSHSLAEIFSSDPQVSYNGQGGLLQTISIRGLSRWRIQTLVEGVPIHTERRAGTAAEFIAPGMVGNAYVFSGTASTQLGSGALGGSIDVQLAASSDTQLSASYGMQQNYRSVQLLGGTEKQNKQLYWGVSLRHANNGEDSLHQTLFNGFEQAVGWVRHVSDKSQIKDALIILSKADHIGKASSDLPEQRQTSYPDNDHWLAKLDFTWMNARLYAHNTQLNTQIVRPSQRTHYLQNKALGWGASIGDDFSFNDWRLNWQLGLDARNGVEAKEQEVSSTTESVLSQNNLTGRQQAWSFNIDSTRHWRNWELAVGVRLEHMRQHGHSLTLQNQQDTNLSGFIGGRSLWSDNWSSGLYFSNGYRVPTLTERFFSGSTPRGVTLGDPRLSTERARSLQADIDYQGSHLSFNLTAFRQSIDHYIERVALSPTLQQYANLGDAQIDGANYQANWTISPSFNLRLQGQWLWGEDNNGAPINDVSPHQHDARIGWQSDAKALWLQMTYRQAHQRPGSGELETSNVVYFRAGYEQAFSSSLTASIMINNITDKAFPVSTDDLAPNALGRDIEINLGYVF